MNLNKLNWEDWGDNAKRALITFKNGYSLSILCGTRYYSNGIDTYEVALIYNNHVVYDLHEDVWSYVTAKEINKIITQVKELGKFKNKDIPDSVVIKILQEKIKRLEKEKKEITINLLNKKAKQIIQLYCDNLDISKEEKEELKRNPYYVKLLNSFNELRNKHEIIKENNRKNMIRANEFSKANKKLVEQINELISKYNKLLDYNCPFTGD